MATDRTIIKGVPPDMTEAAFVAELARVRSPATGAGAAVYRYCVKRGFLPSALLGIFWEESKYGTDPAAICVGARGTTLATHSWGNTIAPSYGDPGVAQPLVRGRFTVYGDWAKGGISTVARPFEHPPYVGKRTVREIIETWAPPHDNNRTEEYIAGVVATINRLGKGAAVGLNIVQKLTNVNIWVGRQGHKPEALAMHVAEGGRGGVDSWFHNPSSEASAHYLVNKDGSIWQFVREEDTAWANGKTNNPNRADPLINAWLNAGINPNRKTISIETEGFWNQDMTPEQLRSVAALAADIHRRYGWPTDGSRLFGHNEFDSVDRARCPSFSRAEWDAILAAVKGGMVVVEKKPIGGIDPGFPDALNERGELVVNGVNFGGRADSVVKAVFTVYNAEEQRYYAIEWAGHQIGPWKVA